MGYAQCRLLRATRMQHEEVRAFLVRPRVSQAEYLRPAPDSEPPWLIGMRNQFPVFEVVAIPATAQSSYGRRQALIQGAAGH